MLFCLSNNPKILAVRFVMLAYSPKPRNLRHSLSAPPMLDVAYSWSPSILLI
jgi:hypothetical protein